MWREGARARTRAGEKVGVVTTQAMTGSNNGATNSTGAQTMVGRVR